MKASILFIATIAALANFAMAQQPAGALQAAGAAANEAYQAKDWTRAEADFREAARLEAEHLKQSPRDFDSADRRNNFEYNAACCAALAGHIDAAFGLLSGLLDRKWYDNNGSLENDPDLVALRKDDARFKKLQKRSQEIIDAATKGHAEGKIILPKSKSKSTSCPGIVALHGGGGNIEQWERLWQPVADRTGAVVILVRGSVIQDPGVFSYNQGVTLRDAAHIEEWIAKAKLQCPGLDENDLFLAGFSQGGGMAWVLGVEGTRSWRGIIPMGGYVQVALRQRVMAAPKHPLAAYAIVGEKDEDAIREVNQKLAARNNEPGLRVHLETLQGAGHGLPPDMAETMERAMKWFRISVEGAK
ncbi:MAG: hypothetical protein K8R92_03450 [Planctomycetes bacterium]|nr:hypothetical protein [Planctomycetota bacterium]